MAPVNYMQRLRLDERELQSRRAFFEITDDDLKHLAGLRSVAEQHVGEVVDRLYELFLGHAESRVFFPDDGTVRRVKQLQRDYFLGLFTGRLDLAYVEDRLRIGVAHERIGLAPKWYIGGYGRYLRLLLDQIFGNLPPADAVSAYRSVTKLVTFDMSL